MTLALSLKQRVRRLENANAIDSTATERQQLIRETAIARELLWASREAARLLTACREKCRRLEISSREISQASIDDELARAADIEVELAQLEAKCTAAGITEEEVEQAQL